MSIRLDPRRLGLLKQLAGEAGVRPGDLVRTWVEERIDGERLGSPVAPTTGVADQLAAFAARLEALEAAVGIGSLASDGSEHRVTDDPAASGADEPVATAVAEPVADDASPGLDESAAPPAAAEEPSEPGPVAAAAGAESPRASRPRRNRVAAAPSGPRVALHDEIIAVLGERGPMSAGELAAAISERGRYAPPRSGKSLDAAMVSQRVSNPTYRARFTRQDGRIGLAEGRPGDDALADTETGPGDPG